MADELDGLRARARAVDDELEEAQSRVEQLYKRIERLQAERQELARRISTVQRAPKAEWADESFPWSRQLRAQLRGVFGLRNYRSVVIAAPAGGCRAWCTCCCPHPPQAGGNQRTCRAGACCAS